MKKNISINISGIIFHIEEDAYSWLKDYLESINKYFSTYEDSGEIIADIESRIAEIFLSKLDDGKQIITEEDVTLLINTMGTIADFEAIEEDERSSSAPPNDEKKEQKSSTSNEASDEDLGKKRLFRDEKRKVLGGVAAGIGYYLTVDPLWIRLLFAALLLNLFIGVFSGAVFLTYIILWIVVPASKTLGDDETVKKMFRDTEAKVMGGVSSGMANYFGVDVTVVRMLFVLSIFLGGTGVILYIILWMITPAAKTITEKMQMHGEPVTLSNIQQSISKTMTNEKGEESPLAKILLFPFRIIAEVFKAFGNLLGPLAKVILEVFRLVGGSVLILVGLVSMIVLFVALGISLGVLTDSWHDYFMLGNIPVDVFINTFSPWLYFAVFIVAFIPFFLMTLLGLSALLRRLVIIAPIGWSVFLLWILGVVMLAIFIPKSIHSFTDEADFQENRTFQFNVEPVTFKVHYLDHKLDMALVKLKGYEDSVYRLNVNYMAKGKSKSDALSNIKMMTYKVAQNDNDLIFDSHFEFIEGAKFRDQKINSTLYIPYGKVFVLDKSMNEILVNTLSRSGYSQWDLTNENRWAMTPEGLKCLTCKEQVRDDFKLENLDERNTDNHDEDEPIIIEYYDAAKDYAASNDPLMSFDLTDFTEIEAYGNYKVIITNDKKFSVRVTGSKELMEDVVVRKVGHVLELGMTDEKWDFIKRFGDEGQLTAYVSLPILEKIKGSGFCKIQVGQFDVDELTVDLSGATTCDMTVDTDDLDIKIEGGSRLMLNGRAKYVMANISGASSLSAYTMKVDVYDIHASGVSKARVTVNEKLIVNVDGLSHVKYKGDPKLDIKGIGGMSSVKPADD